MSWITDAQNQAEENKNREEREKLQQVEATQKLREEKIADFNQITKQTRLEIEKVLALACSQGLHIANKNEGSYIEDGPGNFMENIIDDSGPDYPAPSRRYVYGISWTIQETATNYTMKLTVGVNESNSVLKIETGYLKNPKHIIPSELENEIKNWLVKIFSETK